MEQIRINNFDLIRLLAALQVLLYHAKAHLQINNEVLNLVINRFLSIFPGVPIFFFISGFLIYSSYERNKENLPQFFANRLLRVYPGLWVCLILTILLLLIDYKGNISELFSKETMSWFLGQATIFQFYTPDVLRFWGVGTPNGSLWTITVEVQYYLIIPIIYLFFLKFKKFWIGFGIVFLVSVIANIYLGSLDEDSQNIISKLAGVFILPYLYYFLIGIIINKYWSSLKYLFENKFLIWFSVYVFFIGVNSYLFDQNLISYWITNPFNIIATLLLACLTFSFAYSFIGIGSKLLNGNDISYGLYIYHMLVINFFVERAYFNDLIYFSLVIIITFSLAILSWIFIEKPCLKSKHTILKLISSLKNEKEIINK